MIDIVEQRFDAGVRHGDRVGKDMSAMRIAPDMQMAIVGSPSCFATRKKPVTPQKLTNLACGVLMSGSLSALAVLKPPSNTSVARSSNHLSYCPNFRGDLSSSFRVL
jgi:DNA-binding transcriptional LysR family regulator